jgi:hypothetical protein
MEITKDGLFNELSVYPNPARDMITVVYQHVENELLKLVVYSASGELIWLKPLDRNTASTTFSINELTPGFYYIGLRAGSRMLTAKKLVVR